MIDLKQWIDRNASRPLIYAVAVVLCLQAGYLVYLAREEYVLQLRRIDRVVETASLGLQQNNRPLIESTLLMGLRNSEAAQVALCRGGSADLIYPPSSRDPCGAATNGFLQWRVRKKAVGLDAYDFLFVIRWLDAFGPLLILLAMTAALSPLIVWVLVRARRRFEKDVLAPLHLGLNDERPLDISELDELRRRNQEFNALSRRQAVSEALFALSTQVAHDIRSPLAALESASSEIARLPEEQRTAMRAAVGRIRDIANSLLSRRRELPEEELLQRPAAPALSPATPASACLLSTLLGSIVSEKRLQFRERSAIVILTDDEELSFGLFARVDPVEFGRVLSNLINNAVEALGDQGGTIRVRLTSGEQAVRISVQDSGRGIPPEILSRLGRRGETHGKAGGSGLGLHHARTCAEQWGGRLEIASEPGHGTDVVLILPETPAPEWFAAELRLAPNAPIVVLDDDPSIHHVWESRLSAVPAADRGEVLHFSAPRALREWVATDRNRALRASYLLDYELSGHSETGLSLAEELGIGENVVLVTGRHAEAPVLEGCRRLKARLLPKELARLIPIRADGAARSNGPASRWDAILVDDDPLTRLNWKRAASRHGKRFHSFATMAAFLQEAPTIDRRTPVYIDARLGGGQDGASESLKVHRLGFSEVYLATGQPASEFARLAHLRGIVGKSPPWSDSPVGTDLNRPA